MLDDIKSTKEALIQQLNQLENAEENLNLELKEIMSHPPNHPVIEFIKPIEMPEMEENETCSEGASEVDHKQLQHDFEMGLSLSEESLMGSPMPASPPNPSTPSRQVLFLNDEETAISASLSDSVIRRSIKRSESPLARGHFICGGSLFPILRSASEDDHNGGRGIPKISIRRPDFDDTTQRIPESVDFRTGLSGHVALNMMKRKAANNQIRRNEIRHMGEHRGIGSVGRFKRAQDSPRRG